MNIEEMRRRVRMAARGRLGVAFLASLGEPDIRRLAKAWGVSLADPPPPVVASVAMPRPAPKRPPLKKKSEVNEPEQHT